MHTHTPENRNTRWREQVDQLGCIAYVAVAAPALSSTKVILIREANQRLIPNKQELKNSLEPQSA